MAGRCPAFLFKYWFLIYLRNSARLPSVLTLFIALPCFVEDVSCLNCFASRSICASTDFRCSSSGKSTKISCSSKRECQAEDNGCERVRHRIICTRPRYREYLMQIMIIATAVQHISHKKQVITIRP